MTSAARISIVPTMGKRMSHVTEASSVTHTYYLTYKSAELSLLQAARSNDQRMLHLVSAYVMIAFTLEAYVNDFCAVALADDLWTKMERKATTAEKVRALSKSLNIPVDFSSLPFQEVKPIFQIRDRIAHSKRDVRNSSPSELQSRPLAIPIGDLEKILRDLNLARRFHRAVYSMISQLHRARSDRDHDDHPLEAGAKSIHIGIQMRRTNEGPAN